MPVAPLTAPAVDISKALELRANVPVPLPILTLPVPPVLMLVAAEPETLRLTVPRVVIPADAAIAHEELT